jgi:hypothetical protein
VQTIPSSLISKLSSVIAAAVVPTHTAPYELLKAALLKEVLPDKHLIFDKYFKQQQIGSALPSKFLKKCISDLETIQSGLSGEESLLRRFFLSALPATTQQILTVIPSASLQDLALSADKMCEVTLSHPHIADTCAVTRTYPSSAEAELKSTLELITKKLLSLETTVQNLQHSRSSSVNSRGSSASRRFDNQPRRLLCFYHTKFRDNAKFCNVGCEWKNRPSTCKQFDVCINHARFKDKTRNCLEGCRHSKKVLEEKN